jgi:hypothetical protein
MCKYFDKVESVNYYLPNVCHRSLKSKMPDDNAQDSDLWLEHQRRLSLCLAVAAVTAFYLQCLSIVMASIPQASLSVPSMSQQWADHEIEAILLHFISKKSEIGDAGNFKKKTYVAAAETIRGQARTWEQVKTKWQGVS